MSFLTTPVSTDVPAPEPYVLVAVLDNGKTANLGMAQHFPARKVYRMMNGSLEVAEWTRGLDGVFVTDSGRYRVLTQHEHTLLKRKEAARETRAAAVAIAPPPPARVDTVMKASTSLSALTIKPAAVGCGLQAQKATVFAVGPKHIELAMARIRPLIEMARNNKNVVTIVVLGVENDAEAEAAAKVPTPRIFMAGARELDVLRNRKTHGPTRVYLQEAVLIGLVRGSVLDYGDDGSNGVFCLPAHPVPLDGSLSAIEPRAGKHMAQWISALNSQWLSWYKRYDNTITVLDDRETALLSAYTSFPQQALHPHTKWLPHGSTALTASGSNGQTFGVVDHTIKWRDGRKPEELWPEPCRRWTATPSAGSTSPYWSVATFCGNTSAALCAPMPALDVQLTLQDVEYDTFVTLATLKTRNVASSLELLKGVIGPIILAGRGDEEPMRVTQWRTNQQENLVLLLPESYVQFVLSDYATAHGTQHGKPLICSQGFLALANADVVPVEFSNLTDVEQPDERDRFGARIWRVPKTTGAGAGLALDGLRNLPDALSGLAAYRTQLDADADSFRLLLRPGQRVGTSSTHSVFYTSTVSNDALCGLLVRWSLDGGRPTLDSDTEAGGLQTAYEKIGT